MALQGVFVPVCSTRSGYLRAGTVAETISAASLASQKVEGKPWGVSPQACGIAEGRGTGPVWCLTPEVSHRAWLPRKEQLLSEGG